jgi:hypothetical protein
MTTARIKSIFGLHNPAQLYDHFWKSQGFVAGNDGLTQSIQGAMQDPTVREQYKGFLKRGFKALLEPEQAKATSTTVASAIPLVFDPDILDIMRTDAPLLARLPMRGYAGNPVRVNPITARDAPVGFVSEAASLTLNLQDGGNFTITPTDYDHKIYADRVDIGDFAERVSAEGPINLRETALGARVSEWAQRKEQAILYGDHTQALNDGSPGDAQAFDGMIAETAAANVVDKSAVNLAASDALLKDIKAEIKSLLQNANVNKGDLEIWTSHTLFDELENELQVRAYLDQNQASANYGFEVIYISGIPVIASHNVDRHTWGAGAYTPGDEGDVFIMNKRANAFASLAPLFTVPLGRTGLGDQMAMGEYGTYIDRGNGQLSKYLQAYNI